MPKPSRHQARITAFQIIYSREKLGIQEQGEARVIKDAGLVSKYATFCTSLVDRTWQNLEQIDQYIQKNLKNWKQSRIAPTLNALLRISICELIFLKETESKIIINEAIEICKHFVDEKATKICNGVLHSISETLRVVQENENVR